MNTLHLNSVRLNGIGEVQSVSLSAGADPEQPPVEPSKYIQFEDPAVEAICVANWSSDGIGLTMEDAAKVTSIGTVFYNNKDIVSFNEFEYFTGVTTLVPQAFYGCSNLVSLTLPPNVTAIPNGSKIGGVIKGGVFAECPSLALLDCRNITSIGDATFYNTPVQLTNTDKVVTIGTNAFYGGGAGDVSFPNLETFNNNAMSNCRISRILSLGKIKNVGAAGNQNYGGYGAFYASSLLTFLEFPNTIEEISSLSCARCSALTTIICRATTPPSLAAQVFYQTPLEFIYVPDASLEAYKTATNWSTYADRIHPLSEIEDYYVSDALVMNLDGIDKGGVDGEWRDLVGNNHYHAKADTPIPTALDNGWEFNGVDTMMTCDDANKVSWSPLVEGKTRTMEVVVEFTGTENKSCVFTMGGSGFAFGRTTDKYIVGGRSAGHAVANPHGLSSTKSVFTAIGNSACYENGVKLQGANSDYWLDGWTLGAADNGRYFKGKIHAIRIHDRALTEEEILYNQRLDNKRFNLGLDI